MARVQSAFNKVASSTVLTVTMGSNVTAGNALIVAIGCTTANSTVTFTIADTQLNTYAGEVVRNTTNRTCEIDYCLSAAGGADVITITASTAVSFFAVVEEVSGLSATGIPEATGTNGNTTATTHNAAASGSIDTTATTCYVIAVFASGSAFGGGTPGTSPLTWDELYDNDGSGGRYCQSVEPTSAMTDERCAFTSVSAATSGGCCAAFKYPAASSTAHDLLLLGMGA
jgi:hypothetical protein